jgi:alkylated DNA nucleotide flippase Atl1
VQTAAVSFIGSLEAARKVGRYLSQKATPLKRIVCIDCSYKKPGSAVDKCSREEQRLQ